MGRFRKLSKGVRKGCRVRKGEAEARCEKPAPSGNARWIISVARRRSSSWLMKYEVGNKFDKNERVREELEFSKYLRHQNGKVRR